MNIPRRAAALALVATVGAGCAVTPPGPGTAPSPSPPATAPTTPAVAPASGTPGDPTATPTPGATLDLTRPGAARDMVDRLLDAAGHRRVLMVTVTATDASVAVLEAGRAQTWAWRDGTIQQVPSDITYVAQRTFDPATFELGDLGALFRAAEAVSGSRRGQSLQIVDYSGGLVSMSVSTNPESRAVFFHPDGTLLPTLDFSSQWGLEQGYADAVGTRRSATGLGFGSAAGVHLDTVPNANGTVDRRLRTARTPVLVTPRTDAGGPLTPFDPALVRPAVVWGVLTRLQDEGRFTLDDPWSCVVDNRDGRTTPRLYFTVNDTTFVTDLNGRVIE